MIRTLIVDNEPYARAQLTRMLSPYQEIDIIGQAANGFEALSFIQQHRPDVVFLDIHMPKLSGMELVTMLDPLPRIVFVSAYDEFAIQAFDENAFDYLLKPLSPERLAKTIARLNADLSPTQRLASHANIHQIPGYLQQKVRLLPIDEVEYVFSDLSGVHVACQGALFHTHLTLKALEEKTPLLRIHRQYLIAPHAIFEIHLLDNQLAQILTQQGHSLPVSRRYLKALKSQLGLD